jgi:hypothetical protein
LVSSHFLLQSKDGISFKNTLVELSKSEVAALSRNEGCLELNYLSPLSAVDDDDGDGHDEDDGETDGQDEDDEPHEEADRGGGLRLRRVWIDLLKIGRIQKIPKVSILPRLMLG